METRSEIEMLIAELKSNIMQVVKESGDGYEDDFDSMITVGNTIYEIETKWTEATKKVQNNVNWENVYKNEHELRESLIKKHDELKTAYEELEAACEEERQHVSELKTRYIKLDEIYQQLRSSYENVELDRDYKKDMLNLTQDNLVEALKENAELRLKYTELSNKYKACLKRHIKES